MELRESPEFEPYLAEMYQTGMAERPAIFDREEFARHAQELMLSAYESFSNRLPVFDAWENHLDRAKELGLQVKEVSVEFGHIADAFERRCPDATFTLPYLKETMMCLTQEKADAEIVEHLVAFRMQERQLESSRREIDRHLTIAEPARDQSLERGTENDRSNERGDQKPDRGRGGR